MTETSDDKFVTITARVPETIWLAGKARLSKERNTWQTVLSEAIQDYASSVEGDAVTVKRGGRLSDELIGGLENLFMKPRDLDKPLIKYLQLLLKEHYID